MTTHPGTAADRGRSTLGLILVLGALAAAAVGWPRWGRPMPTGPSRDPARSSPESVVPTAGRFQVHLFWGGGEPRDWEGVWHMAPDPGQARVPWIWLNDFEDDDRLVAGKEIPDPRQRVPSTLLFNPAPSRRERQEAPRRGASLRTRTEGEADGLSFEWLGPASAEVVLDFEGARLGSTIEALLNRPRIVPLSGGQVLMATAQDLRRPAAEHVAHGQTRARRACLHTHSCFSTGTRTLEETSESLVPFARHVWWTDHNPRQYKGFLAGDFEDPTLADRHWVTGRSKARVAYSGVVPPSSTRGSAYRLAATSLEDRPGQAWISMQYPGPGELYVALPEAPTLRFAWKPVRGKAYVEVKTGSGRKLRYWSAPGAADDPSRERVLASTPGEWREHALDLLGDYRQSFGEQLTDGVLSVSFGVRCDEEGEGEVLLDDLDLVLPVPEEQLAARDEAYAAEPRLRSYPGMEQSAWRGPAGFGVLIPHLTLLAPRLDADLFPGLDMPPDPARRRAIVAAVQAAGGCAGSHHLQLSEHYEAFLDHAGFGVDLFEIGGALFRPPSYATHAERHSRDAHGYPAVGEDEVFPLLVRWDRTTARGLLLTVYGAPDLQGRFDEPSHLSFNRWLTWILGDGDRPEDLLRALRRGKAVASEWRSPAIVTVDAATTPWMGKLVVTDRNRTEVRARFSGALPGSGLRWIVGSFVRDRADAVADGEPTAAREVRTFTIEVEAGEDAFSVDTRYGTFVRAELLNPAGHLVALSNPVHFLPYWPERWPFGRVAFDWGGIRLEQERGLLLTSAGIGDRGELRVLAEVFDSPGSLVVGCGSIKPTDVRGTDNWRFEESSRRLVVEGLPAGVVDLAVQFSTPLPRGTTAEMSSLPARKRMVFDLDVGRPEQEKDRLVDGFGPVTQVGYEIFTRRVGDPPARFRLPLPTGEPTWLKLRTRTNSRASGHLALEGREVGRFEALDGLTFALPAQAGREPTVERTLTLSLDPPSRAPRPELESLRIDRIQLFAGPGVVDY